MASGGAARWNERGNFVIYTAATRALACLENVVHRSGEGLMETFRVMVIDISDDLLIDTIASDTLPMNWSDARHYDACQRIGGEWLRNGQAGVLKRPSAIIANEWNYLINPAHPDFTRITLLHVEPFAFDSRIKS